MTNSEKNRQIITEIWAAFAQGNTRPFAEAMDERFSWIMTSSKMAGEWRGKEAVMMGLLTPLLQQFEGTYSNKAKRIFADGDFVIVECKGNVTTKTGKPYCNNYCFVIEMANGKMIELTEYLDSTLVDTALEDLA